MPRERMDQSFSVFNNHVNQAKAKANREFEAQFGREAFEQHIAPILDEGTMLMLSKPTVYDDHDEYEAALVARVAWVTLCTAYVNEKVKYRLTPEGPVPVKRRRRARVAK